MKDIIKKCLILTLILTLFIVIILKNNLIANNIIYTLKVYSKNVFPYLFPSIVVTNLLIYNNFPYYIAKYFKLNTKNYIFIISLLTGCPSNAVMIRNMLDSKQITIDEAERIICYTQFNNPIFLYNMLIAYLTKSITIKIIIINYISSIIIRLLLHKKEQKDTLITKYNYSLSKSLSLSISSATDTLIVILGTLVFFSMIPVPFIFLGLLELTNGLNTLKILSLTIQAKSYLSIIYISFCGLSIIAQIKSILNDTSIKYKYYFKYRLIHLLLSMLLFYMLY